MQDDPTSDDAVAVAPVLRAAILVATIAMAACASNSGQADDFNAFLNRIAAECKPLVIGSDDIGQAIVMGGLGAKPENYDNCLGRTSALYRGTIPSQLYRDSLTAFIGSGSGSDSYNQRSFDCIIARLPQPMSATTPAAVHQA